MTATGPRTRTRTRIETRYLVAYRDGEHRIVDRGTLVYEGNRIVFAGQDYDGPADETVDARDKVVAPGFISMHTHMAGSPFDKSLQDDLVNQHLWGTGLHDILMPIRSAATAESGRAALRASCLELIRSGVTTAVDLSFLRMPRAQLKRRRKRACACTPVSMCAHRIAPLTDT